MMAATSRQRLGSARTLKTVGHLAGLAPAHQPGAHGAHALGVDDVHVAVVQQVLVVLAADHRLLGRGSRAPPRRSPLSEHMNRCSDVTRGRGPDKRSPLRADRSGAGGAPASAPARARVLAWSVAAAVVRVRPMSSSMRRRRWWSHRASRSRGPDVAVAGGPAAVVSRCGSPPSWPVGIGVAVRRRDGRRGRWPAITPRCPTQPTPPSRPRAVSARSIAGGRGRDAAPVRGRRGRGAVAGELHGGDAAAGHHGGAGGDDRRLGGQRGGELGEQARRGAAPGPRAAAIGDAPAPDAPSGRALPRSGSAWSAAGTASAGSATARLAGATASSPARPVNDRRNAARARCTSTSAAGRETSSTSASSPPAEPVQVLEDERRAVALVDRRQAALDQRGRPRLLEGVVLRPPTVSASVRPSGRRARMRLRQVLVATRNSQGRSRTSSVAAGGCQILVR